MPSSTSRSASQPRPAAVAVVAALLLFVRPVELLLARVIAGESRPPSGAEAERLHGLLAEVSRRAGVSWDRLRIQHVGGPSGRRLEPERWPLVCTLGRRRRRRRDRSFTDPGRECGYDTVAGVVERLARRADIPAELRHPHVLRHTYATRYRRRTNDLAGLRELLGHADIRTTMRYVHVAQDELHARVERAFASEHPAAGQRRGEHRLRPG